MTYITHDTIQSQSSHNITHQIHYKSK